MKKIAVILSGCGVFDGAEIHESTLTLLAILKQGATYVCFAPNINQHHVINHISGEEMKEDRNVLIESARIARGNIQDVGQIDVNDFDAVVFPGGFGVAKNLCDFAFKDTSCQVIPEIRALIETFWKAKKPIGALCISPILIAKIIAGSTVTIGNDEATKKAIINMGAHHLETTHGETVVDTKNKIVTTPCYMLDANILQIEEGANNLISRVIELCKH